MLGLGLPYKLDLSRHISTSRLDNLFLTTTSISVSFQLFTILQQWRHMDTSSYRPPSIFEDNLIPQAVRDIRVSLLSKASEIIAGFGLEGWMFIGGGYDVLWTASEQVVRSIGYRYGTKTSTILTSIVFTGLTTLASLSIRFIAKHVPVTINAIQQSTLTVPSIASIKSYLSTPEPGVLPKWSRLKLGLFRAGIVAITTCGGAGVIEWGHQHYGWTKLSQTLMLSAGIFSVGPMVTIGFFKSMAPKLPFLSTSNRTFPPESHKDIYIPLSKWEPNEDDLEHMGIELDDFESNVHKACRDAGVEQSFHVWVKKITDDERLNMEAVGEKTQDEFFGPTVEAENNLVLPESGLINLTEQENMALIAACVSKICHSLPLNTLVLNFSQLLISTGLCLSLTNTLLRRPDIVSSFYPSTIPYTPIIPLLTLSSSLIEPINTVYRVCNAYLERQNIYEMDDKMTSMSPEIRQGWSGRIWARDLGQREGRWAGLDVGSMKGWYGLLFLQRVSASERLFRLDEMDTDQEGDQSDDQDGDHKDEVFEGVR